MKIVLLGPPGSGKGVQSFMLSEKFSLCRVCLGDILREEVKKESDLGKEVKGYMEKGLLVPDEVVSVVVKKNLDDNESFVLDGYPRNLAQAKILEDILQQKGSSLDAVIYLEVNEETVVRRLTARRVCKECGSVYNLQTMPPKQEGVCDKCGGVLIVRNDDREEVVRERWRVFIESITSLVDFYEKKGKLIRIDAIGSKDEVFQRIEEKLTPILH